MMCKCGRFALGLFLQCMILLGFFPLGNLLCSFWVGACGHAVIVFNCNEAHNSDDAF